MSLSVKGKLQKGESSWAQAEFEWQELYANPEAFPASLSLLQAMLWAACKTAGRVGQVLGVVLETGQATAGYLCAYLSCQRVVIVSTGVCFVFGWNHCFVRPFWSYWVATKLNETLRVPDSQKQVSREWQILGQLSSSKCIAAVLGVNERRLSPAGMVDRRFKCTGAATRCVQ